MARKRSFLNVEPEEVPEVTPEPVITPEPVAALEQKVYESEGSVDYEKICRVLYAYLEELQTVCDENFKNSSIVHGQAKIIASKRLKWASRVNGQLVWKKYYYLPKGLYLFCVSLY